ncbi:MAG TPA: FMN-binding protein [Streptosporangiaceae bacterium]|nr:FMN-binding protein [Streptosporangiaceae bacterium]
MRRAGWYLVTGAVAGFAGVLGFNIGGTAAPAALGQPARGATATPSASAAGSAPAATPSARPGGATGKARTAAGSVVQYGYGQLSVRVTVRGSQIVAVSVPVLHTIDQYSQQLAAQVIPMLRSEVLAAHSAQIHGVSGATYTSEAYAQSIQSALDKLHVR